MKSLQQAKIAYQWHRLFLLYTMHIKTYIKEFSSIPHKERQRISGMFASLKAHRISQKKFRNFEKDNYVFTDRNFPHNKTSVNNSILKMNHVQTHRPAIKQRVIKTKQEASFSIKKQNKLKIQLQNKFRTIVNAPNQNHFLYGRQDRFKSTHSNKSWMFKKKQSHNQQMVPEYAKNIMKPCQITTIFLKTRPLTCSKMVRNPQIQTLDQDLYRNRLSSQRERQKQYKQHRYSKSVRQTARQRHEKALIKLQPWQNQNNQEYNMF